MTDTEITHLLATKVMDWSRKVVKGVRVRPGRPAPFYYERPGRSPLLEDGWNPLSDLTDAWDVQDAIRALGSGSPVYRAYCDVLFEHHSYLFVPAPQACGRICYAALRAVGLEPEG